MDETDVFAREAAAVELKAIEQGIARIAKSRDEIHTTLSPDPARARRRNSLMQDGFIRPPPP